MALPRGGGCEFRIPALVSAPLYLAGSLKIVYDLALYGRFRHVKPPEEVKMLV